MDDISTVDLYQKDEIFEGGAARSSARLMCQELQPYCKDSHLNPFAVVTAQGNDWLLINCGTQVSGNKGH